MKTRLALLLCLCTTPVWSVDSGQYENVDPGIRNWFKGVKSPHGIPCCDISDGHYTSWRKSEVKGYEYEVLIEGKWLVVPEEAIIRQHDNPTGSSVIWYGIQRGLNLEKTYLIRCFILEAQG